MMRAAYLAVFAMRGGKMRLNARMAVPVSQRVGRERGRDGFNALRENSWVRL
jgi:hypothetical protein